MRGTAPAGTNRRTLRVSPAVPAVVAAAIVALLVVQSVSASTPSFSGALRHGQGGAAAEADGRVTDADGDLPDGVTVFDEGQPGVVNLDPDLLRVLREAATVAVAEGITFYVTSGWRSLDYQDLLRREAVSEHGSEKEAARWVAAANRSAHVFGHAVDIGSFEAIAWLSEHGGGYGLCQIYANESWHFELRPEASERGCPRMYADPTQDPRMQP